MSTNRFTVTAFSPHSKPGNMWREGDWTYSSLIVARTHFTNLASEGYIVTLSDCNGLIDNHDIATRDAIKYMVVPKRRIAV